MSIPSSAPFWVEQKLRDLDPDEHDFQEFKASPYLQNDEGINSVFAENISKQISAFANGAGGRIFIGIDDSGEIDGGVSTDLKGGGTRSWLEDVVPDLVVPRLKTINIYEICPDPIRSKIKKGRAVYLIEISQSTLAPHQARDKRYYLRIAGKSRPMTHVHVMDVLRRTRSPTLTLARFAPFGKPCVDKSHPNGDCRLLSFRIHILNPSRTLATHVGVEISVPRPLINRSARLKTLEDSNLDYTQRSGDILFFRYHPNPIFPSQECFAFMICIGIHKDNVRYLTSSTTELSWRIYADDAIPVEGKIDILSYSIVQKTIDHYKA